MKLTPIFPAHIKPVRVGVYKVTGFIPEMPPSYYSYWNGKRWSVYLYTVADAFHNRSTRSAIQNKRWQGVLK